MRYEDNYKTGNSNKKKDFPHGGMVVDEDFVAQAAKRFYPIDKQEESAVVLRETLRESPGGRVRTRAALTRFVRC